MLTIEYHIMQWFRGNFWPLSVSFFLPDLKRTCEFYKLNAKFSSIITTSVLTLILMCVMYDQLVHVVMETMVKMWTMERCAQPLGVSIEMELVVVHATRYLLILSNCSHPRCSILGVSWDVEEFTSDEKWDEWSISLYIYIYMSWTILIPSWAVAFDVELGLKSIFLHHQSLIFML